MENLNSSGARTWQIRLKGLLWNETELSSKKQINWKSLKLMAISAVALFVFLVLVLPTEQVTDFSKRIEDPPMSEAGDLEKSTTRSYSSAQRLWEPPRSSSGSAGTQVEYDTPMVLNAGLGNAKTQIRAGQRMSIRFIDRFVVSDNSVPVMAEVIADASSESGLKITAGSKVYGEAVFQKGQARAQVSFTQVSFPNGKIERVQLSAIGKDGQFGVDGNVKSDSNKNTAGSIITSFIAGLATGSVETDAFGGSRGGITNGVLTAVGGAAKERASAYGEKLKSEREWMEVEAGTECDAVLKASFDFQKNGDER